MVATPTAMCHPAAPRSVNADDSAAMHEHLTGTSPAALHHFAEALALVKSPDRDGWELARQRCLPSVLQHEACPCYFLAACRSNPWDAASRFCLYWTERIDLFGEHSFEALTIGTDDDPPTGLSKDDVEVLETGCTQLLPPDRHGRSVIFLDRARLRPHMHHATHGRLRALWYVLQKAYTSPAWSTSTATSLSAGAATSASAANAAAKSDSSPPPTLSAGGSAGGGGSCTSPVTARPPEDQSQSHRLVVLALCSRPPQSGYDWHFAARAIRMPQILPIRAEAVHLLTTPASSGTGRVLQAVIAASVGMLGSFFAGIAKVHHGARDGLVTVREPAGEGSVGGDSAADSIAADLNDWDAPDLGPHERLMHRLRQCGLSKRGLPECAGGPVSDAAFHNWLKKQRRWEQAVHWSPAQRAQRKRDVNRVHSRQKRQRRRQEFQILQDQAERLEVANAQARQLHAHLSALVKQAKVVAQTCQDVPAIDALPSEPLPPAPLPPVPVSAPSAETATADPRESEAASVPPDYGFFAETYSSLLAALEPDPIAPSCLPGVSGFSQHNPLSAVLAPDPIFSHGLAKLEAGSLMETPSVLSPWGNRNNGMVPIAGSSLFSVSGRRILSPDDLSMTHSDFSSTRSQTNGANAVTAVAASPGDPTAVQLWNVSQLQTLLQEQHPSGLTPIAYDLGPPGAPLAPWDPSLTDGSHLGSMAPSIAPTLVGGSIEGSASSLLSSIDSTPYIEQCLAASDEPQQQPPQAREFSPPGLFLHQALGGCTMNPSTRNSRLLDAAVAAERGSQHPSQSVLAPQSWKLVGPGDRNRDGDPYDSGTLVVPKDPVWDDEIHGLDDDAPLDPLFCWDQCA